MAGGSNNAQRQTAVQNFRIADCEHTCIKCATSCATSRVTFLCCAQIDIPELGPMRPAIFAAVQPVFEAWAGGIPLTATAIYGVRVYTRGCELRDHVDVMETHHVSAIVNVDQVRVPAAGSMQRVNRLSLENVRECTTSPPSSTLSKCRGGALSRARLNERFDSYYADCRRQDAAD